MHEQVEIRGGGSFPHHLFLFVCAGPSWDSSPPGPRPDPGHPASPIQFACYRLSLSLRGLFPGLHGGKEVMWFRFHLFSDTWSCSTLSWMDSSCRQFVSQSVFSIIKVWLYCEFWLIRMLHVTSLPLTSYSTEGSYSNWGEQSVRPWNSTLLMPQCENNPF